MSDLSPNEQWERYLENRSASGRFILPSTEGSDFPVEIHYRETTLVDMLINGELPESDMADITDLLEQRAAAEDDGDDLTFSEGMERGRRVAGWGGDMMRKLVSAPAVLATEDGIAKVKPTDKIAFFNHIVVPDTGEAEFPQADEPDGAVADLPDGGPVRDDPVPGNGDVVE